MHSGPRQGNKTKTRENQKQNKNKEKKRFKFIYTLVLWITLRCYRFTWTGEHLISFFFDLQASRSRVTTDTMTMVNFLQASGAPAHPLFSGSNVLQAEAVEEGASKGRVVHVNTEPLEWCIG